MLNALSVSIGADEPGLLRATRSFERQGFVHAASLAWPGGRLDAWSNPVQENTPQTLIETPEGAACCVGPIWYKGRFGNEALRRLLEEVDSLSQIDETQLRGNFALFLCKREKAWLLNDALGFVRIYTTDGERFVSTSWLATRAYTGSAEIDETAAIEYVLLGAPHSDRTVARDVSKLPLGYGLDLSARRWWPRFPEGIAADAPTFPSLDAAVDGIAAHLRTVFGEIASAYPGRTAAALSGGFDSRLITAGLLANGEQPRLFVYGSEDSEDVPIAREVARAVGIDLDVVDKGAESRNLPEPDLESLTRNALFFDGLPNDGIHDSGVDRRTRLQQSAGGVLALNGGGGEIFRNFFHLPDSRFSPCDMVDAFYRGFDARVFRRPFGLVLYQAGLAEAIGRSVGIAAANSFDPYGLGAVEAAVEKSRYLLSGRQALLAGDGQATFASLSESIERSLGFPDVAPRHRPERRLRFDRPLSRGMTEIVYPLFRCHHWMGLNNSLALRYGHFATPLVDLQTVRAAWALPLAWKNAGRLESRLIAALHPGIASQMSSYGFRFSEGPHLRARWDEWINGKRPVSLRPKINSLRRWLSSSRPTPQFVAYWRTMLPGEWQLDSSLDLERLPDDDAFARALSIELVTRQIAP